MLPSSYCYRYVAVAADITGRPIVYIEVRPSAVGEDQVSIWLDKNPVLTLSAADALLLGQALTGGVNDASKRK